MTNIEIYNLLNTLITYQFKLYSFLEKGQFWNYSIAVCSVGEPFQSCQVFN